MPKRCLARPRSACPAASALLDSRPLPLSSRVPWCCAPTRGGAPARQRRWRGVGGGGLRRPDAGRTDGRGRLEGSRTAGATAEVAGYDLDVAAGGIAPSSMSSKSSPFVRSSAPWEAAATCALRAACLSPTSGGPSGAVTASRWQSFRLASRRSCSSGVGDGTVVGRTLLGCLAASLRVGCRMRGREAPTVALHMLRDGPLRCWSTGAA